MKITDIKTVLVSKPFNEWVGSGHVFPPTARDILFATVYTDEGITGTGFVTGLGLVGGHEIGVIRYAVETALRHLVIGEDPEWTEKIWEKMFRGTIRFGRKGVMLRAMSVIDIALWDLKGKMYGVPLYQLLGAHKDACPAYGSGGLYRDDDPDNTKLKAELDGLIADGYRGIKVRVGVGTIESDVERVAKIRELVGPDVRLMVDANEAWSVNDAIRFAKMAEPLNLAWIEEPVPTDNLEGYRRISESTSIPIAAGENEYTRYGFLQLIQQGRVSVCQPDVTRVGGVTEWMKIAHLCSAYDVPAVPHGVHELHIQLVAASPASPLIEFFRPDNVIQRFITECITAPDEVKRVEDGMLRVPSGPGFGLEYDEGLIARYAIPFKG